MRKISLAFAVLLFASGNVVASDCPQDVEATLAAACPCEGQGGQPWGNHGKYVSCVVRLRNDLRRAGCLDSQTQRTIARCAARSTCGKEGAVLCCVYDTTGVCELPAGSCSNDAAIACTVDTDCITSTGPKVKRHEENCTLRGGTVVGSGSVCSGCPAIPPTP